MATENECAAHLMDTVPLVMRSIRAEMQSRRLELLSVAQFRALAFINRNPGASLSDLADHIGLMLPSMSKMVDGLVARKLVAREESPTDRRRVSLSLTKRGEAILESARQGTQAKLAEMLKTLPPSELDTITKAMQLLRLVFQPNSVARTRAVGSQNGDS